MRGIAILTGLAARRRLGPPVRKRGISPRRRWLRLAQAAAALSVVVGCGGGGRVPSATAPPYPYASQSGSVADLSDVSLLVKERPPTPERLQAYVQGQQAFVSAAATLPPEAVQAMAGKSPTEGFAAVVTSSTAGPTLAAALGGAGVDPLDFYAMHMIVQAYAIVGALEGQKVPLQAEAAEAEEHLQEVGEQAQRELAVGRVGGDNLGRLNEEMTRARAMAGETQARLVLKEAVDSLTPGQRALIEKLLEGAGQGPEQNRPAAPGGDGEKPSKA